MSQGPDEHSLDDLLQRGFRYAMSLVHDRDKAQDLVQEACVKVQRKGGPWNAGYLLTVIHNRFVDQYRRRRKITFKPLEHEVAVESEMPGLGIDDDLQRALAQLRAEERELIFMAVVERYTTSEIAERTGRPRGTILSAIHRAKQKLRRVLDDAQAARDAS